jgi:hypothetical protein
LFAAFGERLLQVQNCVRGELNDGFDRTGGNEFLGCGKAILGGAGAQVDGIFQACLSAKYWASLALDSSFGADIDGDVRKLNAVRHFVWSALIAYESNKSAALIVTGIHEVEGSSCPGTARECQWDTDADRNNNSLGATYGAALQHRYGNRWNCVSPGSQSLCLDFDGGGLVNDIVQRAFTQLQAGALDLRGGCPSSGRKETLGC